MNVAPDRETLHDLDGQVAPAVQGDHKPDADRVGTHPPRTPWIDAAKGLTIVLVVAYHAMQTLDYLGYADETFVYWSAVLLPVRMPLFFLIAGLFARRTIYGDLGRFIDSKIVHFMYFYVLWSLVIMAVRYTANPLFATRVELSEILYILWDPLQTIWFLYALVLSFALTRLLRAVDPAYVIAGAAIVQCVCFVYPDMPYIVIFNLFGYLYVYFVIGVYASGWIRDVAERATYAKAVMAGIAFVGLGIYFRRLELIQATGTYFALSCLSAYTIIAALRSASGTAVVQMFQYIGRYSMPIYLTHFIPVAAVRLIMLRVLGIENFYAIFTLTVLICVPFGIMSARLAEGTWLQFLFRRPTFLRLASTGRD